MYVNLIYIILLATIYSLIEIEIEGDNGWAIKLPTPYVVKLGSKHNINTNMHKAVYAALAPHENGSQT